MLKVCLACLRMPKDTKKSDQNFSATVDIFIPTHHTQDRSRKHEAGLDFAGSGNPAQSADAARFSNFY